MKILNLILAPLFLLSCFLSFVHGQQEDFFKKYAGPIPGKVHYVSGVNPKEITLRGVDPSKGIIYMALKMEGKFLGMELELRGLDKQNIRGFEYTGVMQTVQNPLLNEKQLAAARVQKRDKVSIGKLMAYLYNENYDKPVIDAVRPTIYKLMLFLTIPPDNFVRVPIHSMCLTYVRALIESEQYSEAFYILSRLNLGQLDGFGYREFSDAALDLAGKMIRANPKSAKVSLALLKRVSIRDDSGDHESYLRLANSLRKQRLYKEALDEYARLGPIVQKSANSPFKTILKIWPVYCYIKSYELYAAYAARDKKFAPYASQYFNAAAKGLESLDENPPPRQSNEYSLYKLVRALIRVQYARRDELSGNAAGAAENYRKSVEEVTEGIISARVGLDWLPESLLMAGDAYEKLDQVEAAKNVYEQVNRFFPGSNWEKTSRKRMDAL